jgi:gluconokinase
MGVAGAGKTTVGQALADALGWQFVEGDELHPPANIDKMRAGLALSDADRLPWLEALSARIGALDRGGRSAVVACSALTRGYRARLAAAAGDVRFVYLRADAPLLEYRLRTRPGHFAGAALLSSQLAILEEPGGSALTLDASLPPDALVGAVRDAWQL